MHQNELNKRLIKRLVFNDFSSVPLFQARIAYMVQRLAKRWKVRFSNPGRGMIFRARAVWLRGPPSLLYDGYRGVYPRVNRPGRDAEHPPPFSPRKGLNFISTPSLPLWNIIG